jgi:hypothetical protein
MGRIEKGFDFLSGIGDRHLLFYPHLLTRPTVVEPYVKVTSTLKISLQKVSVPGKAKAGRRRLLPPAWLVR